MTQRVCDQFKLTFLNHSSVLIETNSHIVLTDPFWETPAFETWFPSPPSYIHPAYLLAIAKSAKRFSILISHGHDDHCDNRLLSLFKEFPILITKFESPGLLKRIQNIGFTEITELTEQTINVEGLRFNAFIDRDFSLDDSIQVISGDSFRFIHANDCWWKLKPEIVTAIGVNKNVETIYASQIAIADAFPNGYTCFDAEEKEVISKKRISKHLKSALNNANDIKADKFLHYAGHVKIFSNEKMQNLSGFVERNFIDAEIESQKLEHSVEILDMLPGDSYAKNSVTYGIGRNVYSERDIKTASVEYWKKYGNLDRLEKDNETSDLTLSNLLNEFTQSFRSYVTSAVERKNFRNEILSSRLVIKIQECGVSEVKFPNYEESDRVDLQIVWTRKIADQILNGDINFEASYIGCIGEFSVCPTTLYNGHMIRWLSMFGYVWQKGKSRSSSNSPTPPLSNPTAHG